jgi:hypothetical protein
MLGCEPMDYKQIESLKMALINLAKQGSSLKIPLYNIDGRIVGVGFKPYWTSPLDSKIDKLEINYVDRLGRVIPFRFYNIIGYDVISNDGRDYDSMKNVSLDIHVYSPDKSRDEEPYEKVRIDIFV